MSERFINPAVASVPPSAIRKFFDTASTMKDAISLGVGEPDFVTPFSVRNSAIDSLLDGETQYTTNYGILPPLDPPVRNKNARYEALSARALHDLDEAIATEGLLDDRR